MIKKKIIKVTPSRIILLSVLITIVTGTLLLSLPLARTTDIAFIDLFFTATSVTCVTGLLSVPLSHFSSLGHCIILVMMQIGGLGLITLTLFLMSLFVELGFGTQLIAGQVLELESWKNINKIITFIITFTVLVELGGALIIFMAIHKDYSLLKGIFLSIFHATAAFCNAGLVLFPYGMIGYHHNYLMLLTTIFLMLIGGLGFITWNEIYLYLKSYHHKKRFHISLHSKIVLLTVSLLIISSTILFWTVERNNIFENFSPLTAFINALFNAVSSSSTGFLTVPVNELQMATIFVIMVISFIGSSPGSTGSGIKTTTFTIILATVRAAIGGKSTVSIKGRSIPRDQIYKGLAVITLSLSWIVITTFCLLITEKTWEFNDVLLETISAFATLGLSTGSSATLTYTGKLFIMTTMIIGRIGAFAIVLVFYKKPDIAEFSYPEERVMLS